MSRDLTTMVIMTQLYQPFHYLISSSLDCLPYNSFDVCSENLVLNQLIIHKLIFFFITPILKSLAVPVIWLALIDVSYSRIAPFFALNGIFFPGNEEATLKTKRPISCLKLPIKLQKNERQRVSTFFATFVSKTLTFSPQRMDEFNFRPAQYCINKMFELTKSCIWVILKLM